METTNTPELNPQASSRWPRSRIDELIQEYHRSNLSQKQFAQQAGVKYSTFIAWLSRARRDQSTNIGSMPNWVAVELKSEAKSIAQPYQIQWADGVSLWLSSGFNAEELRQLLTILRASCSR